MKGKKKGGYLTLEVTLLMPMILGIILFVMYIWFFRYNRCIMEQNAMELVWNGKMGNGISVSEEPLFYLWEGSNPKVEYSGNKLIASAQGKCLSPLMGLDVLSQPEVWESRTEYSIDIRKQTELLRTRNEIEGILTPIEGSEGE